jgi:hypothetical protein
MQKVLALVFFLSAACLFYMPDLARFSSPRFGQPPELSRLESLWAQDLSEIKKQVPEFANIGELSIEGSDDLSKTWIKELKAPIKPITGGELKVEVLLILNDPPSPSHAVIIHHFTNRNSNNSVLEISRTYDLL